MVKLMYQFLLHTSSSVPFSSPGSGGRRRSSGWSWVPQPICCLMQPLQGGTGIGQPWQGCGEGRQSTPGAPPGLPGDDCKSSQLCLRGVLRHREVACSDTLWFSTASCGFNYLWNLISTRGLGMDTEGPLHLRRSREERSSGTSSTAAVVRSSAGILSHCLSDFFERTLLEVFT